MRTKIALLALIALTAPGKKPSVEVPSKPLEWVIVPGGEFTMGTDTGDNDSRPAHKVAVKTFEMTKTLVTVGQYAECVSAGACTVPDNGGYCNWGRFGRQRHPVNCVDWNQANRYAAFKGARLPSEAEWEYAATSGGKTAKSGHWCDSDSTVPVCTGSGGNTAHGLCNMVGHFRHWVRDNYRFSYNGAPADGSAWEGPGSWRVTRGRTHGFLDACAVGVFGRGRVDPAAREASLGFRLARSR